MRKDSLSPASSLRSPVSFTSLPFDEAIAFLREKINLQSKAWTDLWQGMHSRGFVVAGATKDELLVDIHNALEEAIAQGTTFNDFKKNFRRIVAEHGWTGSEKSPITDEGSLGWRAATIFNTNMRTSYAAGQYKQMTSPAVLKARPFWRYIGGLSRRPRPLHLQWNGIVLPAGNPWWHSHYPPNGWGCKCKVVSMSGREMARDGLSLSNAPDDGDRDWTNPNSGETIQVPNGIDPGWAYNPGAAKWGEIEAGRLIHDGKDWKDVGQRGPSAYPSLPEYLALIETQTKMAPLAKGETALRRTLRVAIGGDEASFSDPAGDDIKVTQALVTHMLENKSRLDGREAYFPFIPELIQSPAEIWINFRQNEESGRIDLRKRYVKGLKIEDGKTMGLVAEVANNLWTGLTFFDADSQGMENMRKGRLLWPGNA